MLRTKILITVLLVVLASHLAHAAELPPIDRAAADKLSFRGDVWPIVKRHCWACHTGADAKGKLKLDSVADMLKGGETGPLFAPGKPDESLLLKMVHGDKPEMPKTQPPLSAAKIQTLRGWVLAGAKDDSLPTVAEAAVRIPEAYKFAPAVTSVTLSPDGKLAAAACRSEVLLVEVEGETPPRRFATKGDLVTHVEFSPDGNLLAVSGGTPGRHGELRFLKVADGTWAAERRIGGDTLFRGSFAPDGKTFAVGAPDGAVHLVPTEGQGEIRRLELHSDWVLDAAYSPDGKMLVSGGRDKATKVTSVESGRLIRSVDASTDWISSVAASDEFAISSGRGRRLTAYEFKSALQGVELTGGGNDARPVNRRDQYARAFENPPDEILDFGVSGDRKLLAVAGAFAEVRVYRVADRQRTATIPKIAGPVYSVSLNQDGSRLAIGAKSGLLQIYELPGGKLLKSLTPAPVMAHAGQAYSLADVEKAVNKSLPILWKGVAGHSEHRKCFTCHSHGLPLLAFTTARARGFDVDEKQMAKLAGFLGEFLESKREGMENGRGPDGGTDTTGYLFLGLEVLGHQPDKSSAAIVKYTLSRDKYPDHWRPLGRRPPSEASNFTSTALAIRGMTRYAGADQQDDVAKRVEAAREWLVKTPAADTEDRVFRLLGLHAANAAAEDARKAADELAKSQREDGGWSQLDKLESDAYATGSALYALHTAGAMPTDNAAYRRGLAFLLKTQRDDGSWQVTTRSSPIQTYFESGFPHGKDQFISCAATSWATTALALSCPIKKKE